jgi:transposase-like protein
MSIIQETGVEEKLVSASLEQFFRLIPDEGAARLYLEARRWNGTPVCVHCYSFKVVECKDHKPLPYRCRVCRKHFSVRAHTMLAKSRTELHKWLLAIHLMTSSPENLPLDEMARALGATEETTQMLAECIRDAWQGNRRGDEGKDWRRTRRRKARDRIEWIDAEFDEVVLRMVTFTVGKLPSPHQLSSAQRNGRLDLAGERGDEMAGYQYDRIRGALRIMHRMQFVARLQAWEKTLADELWEEFGRVGEWRDSLCERPSWWDGLVVELMHEVLHPDVGKKLKAGKS